jgi:hypothetical protein
VTARAGDLAHQLPALRHCTRTPKSSLIRLAQDQVLDCFRESLVIHWTVGLLNRPQRKPLSRTESGILKVNKINPAIATSTDERFVVSKDKGGE